MTEPRLARTGPSPSARVYRLEDPPEDDLSSCTTVQERVAMVALLSRRMWEISGLPWPSYTRANLPVAIIRPE